MPENNRLRTSFTECVPLFIALGDGTRLNIIQSLYEVSQAQDQRGVPGLNVKEITEQTNLSRPAVSHHLKLLKESGLISVEKRGVCNYYYLTSESAIEKLSQLREELQKNTNK